MVSLSEHKRPDGSINWDSLRKAELDAGERCIRCYQAIIFGKGGPQRCSDCKSMESTPGTVDHSRLIRCPRCRHIEDVREHSVWTEGEHLVSCNECSHDYEISTRCTFSFESPALDNEV